MTTKTPIVKVFESVVANVSAKLTSQLQDFDPLITGVHYQHGHPIEVIETMNQFDKSETFVYEKYPLIALFQDFTEERGAVGLSGNVKLHLIIARATLRDYKASERYENNFIPVLYPIYEAFLDEIVLAGKYFEVRDKTQIKHTKIDRLYWGREGLWKNEKNIFNDFVDAIEIRDLELKVNLRFC